MIGRMDQSICTAPNREPIVEDCPSPGSPTYYTVGSERNESSATTEAPHCLPNASHEADGSHHGWIRDGREVREKPPQEGMTMSGVILIVDDDAADRTLLRTILSRAGYSVHEVAKGRDAIQQA